MLKRFSKEWFNKGNETDMQFSINTKRWYLPLGTEYRYHTMVISGAIQRRYSIGFLCFQVIYTKYKGESPYTKSLKQY